MASAGKWLYLWNYFNQTRSSRREVNDATQPICVRKVGWMNTWLGQISNHPSIDGSIPYRVDRGRHFVCRMYINIYIYMRYAFLRTQCVRFSLHISLLFMQNIDRSWPRSSLTTTTGGLLAISKSPHIR